MTVRGFGSPGFGWRLNPGYTLIGDDVDFDFAITAVRVREEGETETP